MREFLAACCLVILVLGAIDHFWVKPDRAMAQVSACGGVSSTNACRPTFLTVALLPACNANSQGIMYMVNDATAPTALSTVAGGGAVHVGVTCSGSAWIVE